MSAARELRDICVEVSGARTNFSTLLLRVGERRAPLTIGTRGEWAVQADEVAEIHAHLAYDGTQLFIASAGIGRPVLLAGEAVPAEWTPVPVPSVIVLGRSVVRVYWARPDAFGRRPTEKSFETTRMVDPAEYRNANSASPPTQRVGTLPGNGMAPAKNSPQSSRLKHEATAVLTSPMAQTGVGVGVGLKAGANATPAVGVTTAPSIRPVTAESMAPLHPSPVPAKPTGFWRNASLPRKAVYVLTPLVLIAFIAFSVGSGEEEPNVASLKKGSRPVAADKSPASQLEQPSANEANDEAANSKATESVPVAVKSAEAPSPPSSAAPAPPASAASGPAAEGAPAAATLAPAREKTAAVTSLPTTSNGRTRQRQAIDLVAAGSFGEAARIFGALAAQDPNQREFAEAARILSQKEKAPTR